MLPDENPGFYDATPLQRATRALYESAWLEPVLDHTGVAVHEFPLELSEKEHRNE
jgi:hypothetical protein